MAAGRGIGAARDRLELVAGFDRRQPRLQMRVHDADRLPLGPDRGDHRDLPRIVTRLQPRKENLPVVSNRPRREHREPELSLGCRVNGR